MRFFYISEIIKVEVSVISQAEGRVALIIYDITKTSSNNCFQLLVVFVLL